jgi:hypothetical protein
MSKLSLPKSMGACADKLFEMREQRLQAQKVVDDLKAQESALRDHIIDNLPKGDTGASGKHHQCRVYTDQVPRIEDSDKLFAYIKKTGNFDLLQRRLNDAAVKERWEDKVSIPGVESFGIVKVSLTKIKGK